MAISSSAKRWTAGALIALAIIIVGVIVIWKTFLGEPNTISKTVTARGVVLEKVATGSLPWSAGVNGRFALCGAVDHKGLLWIGGEDNGVWMRDSATWRHFTTAEGLADDSVYAIAVDLRGRVWVGHLRNGVSVYDGNTWTVYG